MYLQHSSQHTEGLALHNWAMRVCWEGKAERGGGKGRGGAEWSLALRVARLISIFYCSFLCSQHSRHWRQKKGRLKARLHNLASRCFRLHEEALCLNQQRGSTMLSLELSTHGLLFFLPWFVFAGMVTREGRILWSCWLAFSLEK